MVFLIMLGIYAFYFCLSSGINTSNDGAHAGLAKAIYYDHELSVGKYFGKYVQVPDYAMKDGVMYSDRLPGTALLMIPYFAYANLLDSIGVKNSLPDQELDIVIASMLPPLFGMLSALLLFWYYFKVLYKPFRLSLLCTVICAFGTLALLESTHLFSHAPSLFFVSLAVLLVISKSKYRWQMNLMISVVLLGVAALIELQNFLYFAPLFLYVALRNQFLKKDQILKLVKPAFLSVLIIGIFLCGLCFYNYLAFDDFTLKSNKYNPFFTEEASFLSALSGDFLLGLDQLYTSFSNIKSYYDPTTARLNDIPGVFVTSPVMILSVIGFFIYQKKHRLEALLLLSCITIATLIAALHVTTLVRHIHTITLFLFLPFIYCVEYILQKLQGPKKQLALGILILLVLISFVRVGYSTVSYWGRNLDNLFVYVKELPLFLIANLPFLILMLFLLFKQKKKRALS